MHHWCAVWSDGVRQVEGEQQELENMDKAVISGIQRVWHSLNHLASLAVCTIEMALIILCCVPVPSWYSCVTIVKGWELPSGARQRGAHGFTTSLARQPVDLSSP